MPTTLRSFAQERLAALCRAVHFDEETAADALDTLVEPWGERPLGEQPPWPSDITDDHTPVELSLSLGGDRADPRLLVEAQGEDGSSASAWGAAALLNQRLRRRYGVSLARLAKVEALFKPSVPNARFAMWHAVWLRPNEAPLFKVYLNPAAHGRASAPALVKEALSRLGFSRAWSFLAAELNRRAGADELIYFSLDLSKGAEARVKTYIAHPNAHAEEIEPLLASGPYYEPGDAQRFCRATTGSAGPFNARPLVTCFAFTAAADAQPESVTLHVPIRCYVASDELAQDRVASYLGEEARPIYRRAVAAVAGRPLKAGAGIQTYASLQRKSRGPRVTAYLALEAYSGTSLRRAAARPSSAVALDGA